MAKLVPLIVYVARKLVMTSGFRKTLVINATSIKVTNLVRCSSSYFCGTFFDEEKFQQITKPIRYIHAESEISEQRC